MRDLKTTSSRESGLDFRFLIFDFRLGAAAPNSKWSGGSQSRIENRKSKIFTKFSVFLLTLPALDFHAPAAAPAPPPCRIEVVEKGTGWPVPLVELRTTNAVRFVTDNAGVVAFDLPELMGQEVWFDVNGYGYEREKDGLGYRGARFKMEAGKTFRVEVSRTIVAKRIGRITGAGLFGESQKTGRELNWKESGEVGRDSVLTAVYMGRLFWLWGDTSLAKYPLGIFNSTSATSALQPLSSFEPPLRLKLGHFRDKNGAIRGVAKMPGDGPTWLSGYVALKDARGKERLVATFSKIRNHLEEYERGLCVWNDETESFELLRVLWTKPGGGTKGEKNQKPPPSPTGNPVLWKDEQGKEWVLFGNPFPVLRCPATFEAWQDSTTWELLKPQETVRAAAGQANIQPHTGAIAWNAYRQRWVTIFVQKFGKPSFLGEIWYAEAKSPTGPWGPAVKVLSHENYSFYNPQIHAGFTPSGSPVLFFEGTFTDEFANKPHPVPRYNYNQILYRLDLDDAALAPCRF